MADFDHWMRFHVGDYLADTMHLSTFQHGIYILLIMHYFKRGPLPDDERVLMRIAKVPSAMAWRKQSPPVIALFKHENGALLHTRIELTRAEAKKLSEIRRSAGKSGASKRWSMANAISDDGKPDGKLARARATPQPQPQNPPSAPPSKGGRRGRSLNRGGESKEPRNAFVAAAREIVADDRIVPLRRAAP